MKEFALLTAVERSGSARVFTGFMTSEPRNPDYSAFGHLQESAQLTLLICVFPCLSRYIGRRAQYFWSVNE